MSFSLDDFINSNPTLDGNDTINLWISQSINSIYTASYIQGLTIPAFSDTNGDLSNVIRESSELVFKYYETKNPETTYRYYKSEILTKRKLSNYFYIKLKEDIEIPLENSDFNIASSFFEIGFIPNNLDNFNNSDFNSQLGSISENRKSKNLIEVNRIAYSPSRGSLVGTINPVNIELIRSISSNNDLINLPEDIFLETQDSNYSSLAWSNIRYNGVEENGLQGSEPALIFHSFIGAIFPTGSKTSTIKEIFSSSIQETENRTFFYSSYKKFSRSNTDISLGYYFESDELESNFLPYSYLEDSIFASGQDPSTRTYVYEIVQSTPRKVVNSKIYKIDSGQVFNINDDGIIQTIE